MGTFRTIGEALDARWGIRKGHDWFWIAGIVKQDAFAMLTTAPGPDMNPYHDRQICVMEPEVGMHWLKLGVPETDILRAPPKGTLRVRTLRVDGVEVA